MLGKNSSGEILDKWEYLQNIDKFFELNKEDSPIPSIELLENEISDEPHFVFQDKNGFVS
jgi:hypothetical protein